MQYMYIVLCIIFTIYCFKQILVIGEGKLYIKRYIDICIKQATTSIRLFIIGRIKFPQLRIFSQSLERKRGQFGLFLVPEYLFYPRPEYKAG